MNDYTSVADLYDLYVTAGQDLEFWSRQARSATGPILELTAGTGRATVSLAESAFPVTCLDLSAAMLGGLVKRFAAARRPPRPVCADLCRLPFLARRFALVAVPFHSFAEVVDATSRQDALHEVRRVLAPGGRLVLTLHNPAQRRRTLDGEQRLLGRHAVEGGSLEVWVRGLLRAQNVARSEQTYRFLDPGGNLQRTRTLVVDFALVEGTELSAMTWAAGLEPKECFGDYDGSPYDPATSPFHLTVFGPGTREEFHE